MDWKSFIKDTRKKFANLNKEIPDTFEGFNLMGKEAKKNGIVDEKTKEFVALGIAISTRCESCIGMHVEALISLGTSKDALSSSISSISQSDSHINLISSRFIIYHYTTIQ